VIRPLRQRHRRVFAVLGVLLPVAFIAGLAARNPVPTMATLPAEIVGDTSRFTTVVWKRTDLFEGQTILTRLLTDDAGTVAIALSPKDPLAQPDLMAYWSDGNQPVQDRLPDDAVLLGAMTGIPAVPLGLPDSTTAREGRLILYSLADHEIVARSSTFSATPVQTD
jgi:hypothetical protein